MTPHHRPSGPRARSAHNVRAQKLRAAYTAHKAQARSREPETRPAPPKPHRRAEESDHTVHWPAWTDEVIPLDALPWEESACLDAIDRIGRPVTAGELSFLNSNVHRLGTELRNKALAALVERTVLVRRGIGAFVLYGFPEHFEDREGEADGQCQ